MQFGQLALYAALVFGLCAVMLGLSWVLGQRSAASRFGREPYESGIVSTGGARLRLSARFYLVAMLFVILLEPVRAKKSFLSASLNFGILIPSRSLQPAIRIKIRRPYSS